MKNNHHQKIFYNYAESENIQFEKFLKIKSKIGKRSILNYLKNAHLFFNFKLIIFILLHNKKDRKILRLNCKQLSDLLSSAKKNNIQIV